MTLEEQDLLVNYEVRGSFWAQYLYFEWMQYIAGKYFAWKIRRKYRRMKRSILIRDGIKAMKEFGL